MSTAAAPNTRRALTLAFGLYLVWVLATYLLEGVRAAIIDGDGVAGVAGDLGALVAFAVVLIPLSIVVFGMAERWAKRTGRLKRQG